MSDIGTGRAGEISMAAIERERRRLRDEINWPALGRDPRLREIRHRLDGNELMRLSLPRAARIASLEPTYFSSMFRRKVGVSFVVWRTRLRLSRALKLLADSNRKIGSVAQAVGYSDIRPFERAFRKQLDMTPTVFRNSLGWNGSKKPAVELAKHAARNGK